MMLKWKDIIANEIISRLEDNIDMDDAIPSFEIRNDGIGYYEYWGAVGYDKGEDYVYLREKSTVLTVDIGMSISIRLLILIYSKLVDFIENYYNDYESEGVIWNFDVVDIEIQGESLIIIFNWNADECKVDDTYYDECIDF